MSPSLSWAMLTGGQQAACQAKQRTVLSTLPVPNSSQVMLCSSNHGLWPESVRNGCPSGWEHASKAKQALSSALNQRSADTRAALCHLRVSGSLNRMCLHTLGDPAWVPRHVCS